MSDNKGIAAVSPIKENHSLSEAVRDQLLKLIREEVFPVGERLPSEPELARQMNVSRPVIREALQMLQSEGIVLRKHGLGTFVQTRAPRLTQGIERLSSMTELIRDQGRQPGTARVTIHRVEADTETASRLSVDPGAPVLRIERVRTADGIPFAVDTSVFRAEMLPADIAEDQLIASLFEFLEAKMGIRLTHSVCRFSAVNADPATAASLSIRTGDALLRLDELYYDQHDTLICLGSSTIRTDMLSFAVLRRRPLSSG